MDNNSNSNARELSFGDLLSAFWQQKLIIVVTTLVFAAASIGLALMLPNEYKSEATVVPAAGQEGNGSGQLAGKLGGIAAMAGINLGSSAGPNRIMIGLEVLNSREFLMGFIERHQILPEILAVKGWRRDKNALVYDEDMYLPDTQQWVRDVDPPKQKQPSYQEALSEFRKMFTYSKDDDTGVVKISIEYVSPYLAKQWVDWIVHDLNENMRERERKEATKSLGYLRKQLEVTSLSEVRAVLYNLVEEQTKTLMFADVRDEYLFQTVDPAIVPEQKSKPSRAIICIIGTLLGGMLGCFIVLIRVMVKNEDGYTKG